MQKAESIFCPLCALHARRQNTGWIRISSETAEKLKKVETFTAGRLLEEDLTRFLSMPEKVLPEASLYYIKAYDKFCETVIVPQILQDKKLLLLKSLTESFVKIIKEVEGVESSYRSSNVKNS